MTMKKINFVCIFHIICSLNQDSQKKKVKKKIQQGNVTL